ncbi:MAG: SGNH/GDSL hydrolase family protein [Clostridia bacterium]|nr:SGNH/GDSL hydrolase family protein [Clostridia bacterium]
MDLKGKKVYFLGDSITFGVGPSDYSRIYHSILAERLGFEAFNHGMSGACIARFVEGEYDIWDKMPFCLRIEDIPSDCDLLVIFGGTNDFGRAVPVRGREGTDDLFTFVGATRHLLTRAKERFPNAKTVFLSPFPRSSANTLRGFAGSPLIEYVKVIYSTCREFSAPVCDLYNLIPVRPDEREDIERYLPDGLHPNDAGHEMIADLLEDFLKKL